jgi:SAM-dependent methyltransferase
LSEPTLIWHRDFRRPARCPVCGHHGETRLLLDISSKEVPNQQLTFAKCPRCGTVFQLDFAVPQYEEYNTSPVALKFYVEQGAGLETLVLPACIARSRPVDSYLEVGCGFGFGLDFARHSFGWRVRGIDPSPIADQGRKAFGLQIERSYLTRQDAGGVGYDAIAAIEVLEHIDSPNEFLSVIKANLSPDGILVLSTPDADYIEFGVEKPGLLSVLSSGYHAVLYTADSMKIALQNAGFSETQVAVRGATLLAIAGAGASTVALDRAFDPNLYRAYLETRSSAAEPGSILKVGFSFRLFKYLVNNGLYADAEAVLSGLAETIRQRDGIDVLDPHRLLANEARPRSFEDFISRLPACLAGVLFFNGMLRLNHHEDRASALACFYAAHVMAGIFQRAMRDFGIDDGETAALERSARDHVKIVLGWMSG